MFGVDTKEGKEYYLREIMKKNPKYILYKSTELNDRRDILKNCREIYLNIKKMLVLQQVEILLGLTIIIMMGIFMK